MSKPTAKLGREAVREMTEREIYRALFAGASPSEHRGLRDAFTDEAILVMVRRDDLPFTLRGWALDTLDSLDPRQAPAAAKPAVCTAPRAAERQAPCPPVLRSGTGLAEEIERAIVEDAFAAIEVSPTLPSREAVCVYLRTGPRFARVFWARRGAKTGSILHFVELATGAVLRAKSARQVGEPTGRVVAGLRKARHG
ncbi:hypothetical protein ARNL5_03046 [Anaerolineae bacterium]|nr:hypothetical protein ARNL5_03046 [Anaerolineae bacterium]